MMLTYPLLLDHIQDGTPFAFTRWGDGEILAVLGDASPNCDGHHRRPDLQEALKKVLEEQNEHQTMYMGLQSLGDNRYPDFKRMYPNIQWSNADIIHIMNMQGGWWLFAQEINKCPNICLISNHHKVSPHVPENCELKYHRHIPVPEKDCWEWPVNWENIGNLNLFCASMAANVWISWLWKSDPSATYIDLGSAYDPYTGIISRRYHHAILDHYKVPADQRTYAGSQRNFKP